MKTAEQINAKIEELNTERLYWVKKQQDNEERELGSEKFEQYQQKEFEYLSQIRLLEWVL